MKKRNPPDELLSTPNGHYGNNGIMLNLYNPNKSIPSMSLTNDAKKLKLDQSSALLQQLGASVSQAPVTTTNGFNSLSSLIASVQENPTLAAIDSVQGASSNSIQSQRHSKVVHLRNLPSDLSDADLVNICYPFGRITNFLVLNNKGQAFVEYEEETSASLLVSVSQTSPISLKGRIVFCQFSTHQELKTDNSKQLSMFTTGSSVPGLHNCSDTAVLVSQTQHQPNAVLRVIIENMIYSVTLDILYQIFSGFGKVLRIITFTKNTTFQALIQFSESSAAQIAKSALDGKNVYNGCCTLRIDFSKLATLNVKYNNEKSRDYTNPNLPSGDVLDQALGINLAQYLSSTSPLSALHSANSLAALPASPYTAPSALSQFAALQAAAAAGGFSMPTAFNVAAAMASNNAAGVRLSSTLSALSLSPVVLVSNLHEEKVTPDALFTLFGVYGDVQRVKILYNKKDNALVQYAEPAQAQLAIQHLDKTKLWGKTIRVASSKHNSVQMPKEGQPQDAGLTKDYSQSSLHRFKKPGSKNYMNIYPPSATLHLSNIPSGTTEEFLTNAFTEAGFKVKAFKFFPKDHKMALMQMESVDDALLALISMHNFRLAENAHLRVSFSKSGV